MYGGIGSQVSHDTVQLIHLLKDYSSKKNRRPWECRRLILVIFASSAFIAKRGFAVFRNILPSRFASRQSLLPEFHRHCLPHRRIGTRLSFHMVCYSWP